jgi:DNA-binding response OmpR family regulator
MGHILVVDDEPAIVAVVRERLEREGFHVRAVASGEEALSSLEANPADLVVLDLTLPGLDGLEVLRRLRSAGDQVPVIVLSARDEDVDMIVGLELGADDYMVKPFNPRELSARIRAVLRRQVELKTLRARLRSEEDVAELTEASGGIAVALRRGTLPPGRGEMSSEASERAPTGTASLRFDPGRHQAWFRGRLLLLRPKEYELLQFLARHPGQVFSREALLSHVWGHESYVGERTVDVHIRRLRGKLAAIAPGVPVILTEWGIGYRLAEEP